LVHLIAPHRHISHSVSHLGVANSSIHHAPSNIHKPSDDISLGKLVYSSHFLHLPVVPIHHAHIGLHGSELLLAHPHVHIHAALVHHPVAQSCPHGVHWVAEVVWVHFQQFDEYIQWLKTVRLNIIA